MITIPNAAKTNNPFSATRSPSLPYGSVLAGDILLAGFITNDAASFNGSPPSPWIELQEQNQGTARQAAIFWKRATGSESGSEEWTNLLAAIETGTGIMLALRGALESGDPFSVLGVPSTTSSGTSKDTSNITPLHPDCLAIALICHPFSRTFIWNAGITEELDSDTSPSGGDNPGWFVGSKQLSGTPVTSLGGDADASCATIEFIYAVRPAEGGGSSSVNPIVTVV